MANEKLYTLPKLPYDYAALEPFISKEQTHPAPHETPPGIRDRCKRDL